jgi:hypothetical protein
MQRLRMRPRGRRRVPLACWRRWRHAGRPTPPPTRVSPRVPMRRSSPGQPTNTASWATSGMPADRGRGNPQVCVVEPLMQRVADQPAVVAQLRPHARSSLRRRVVAAHRRSGVRARPVFADPRRLSALRIVPPRPSAASRRSAGRRCAWRTALRAGGPSAGVAVKMFVSTTTAPFTRRRAPWRKPPAPRR